jgi:hypothetical protein
MTTKTAPKTKSATQQLLELERERDRAKAELTKWRRTHSAKQSEAHALLDTQRRHAYREPRQYDAHANPVDGTEAAEIKQRIESLGQVDFTGEVRHSERVLEVAQADVDSFIEIHRQELLEDIDWAGAVSEWSHAADTFRDAASRIISLHHRVSELGGTADDATVDTINAILGRLEGVEVNG